MHKTGFNHYSAECLVKGGGREEGVMDFVQYVFHAVLFLQADFSLLTVFLLPGSTTTLGLENGSLEDPGVGSPLMTTMLTDRCDDQ